MDIETLIESWEINNRINLYLLDSLAEEHLLAVAASKGRNTGEQFAHIHNVRLMWLKAAAPALLEGQTKIDKGELSKEMLSKALCESSTAMSALLQQGFATGKVKGFKPHPAAFFAYILAHEAHHRGQIMLIVKQAGHRVNQQVQYGLWEWGSR